LTGGKIYLHATEGYSHFFNIIFKYNDENSSHLNEFIEYNIIKVKDVQFFDNAWTEPYWLGTVADTSQAMHIEITFEFGPTIEQIKNNVELSVKFIGGSDDIYPFEIAPELIMYKNKLSQNGASVTFNERNLEVYARVVYNPKAHIDSIFEPSDLRICSKFSNESYDRLDKSASRSSEEDSKAFNKKPGKQFGKIVTNGNINVQSHLTDLGNYLLPPIYWTGSFYRYVYENGGVFLTINVNDESYTKNPLFYPKQATWMMQSGHGLHSMEAGFANNALSLSAIDSTESNRPVYQVLKEKWKNVRIVILNSCYNLNLKLKKGSFPDSASIWYQDLSDEYNQKKDGRSNNGLRWFEMLGFQGAILGWGHCMVADSADTSNITYYGAGRMKKPGMSPLDRINHFEWTAAMMELFLEKVKKLPSTCNGAQVAYTWVKSAENIINKRNKKEGNNRFNAVAIGNDGNKIEAWALLKNSDLKATTVPVWQLTK
jgi:hypothetical protein